MTYKYAYQGTDNVARGVATSVQVSLKSAVMLAQFLRGKDTKRAERELREVMSKRTAVPFTRFHEGAGHKPGIGPGKYPIKTADAFLKLLLSVVANAQDKGMGDELKIVGLTANKASQQPRYGRHRGRMGKAIHIELIVAESEAKPEKKTTKKAAKTTAKATKESKEKSEDSKTDSEKSSKQAEKKEDVKAKPKEEKPKPATKKTADKTSEKPKSAAKKATKKATKEEKK